MHKPASLSRFIEVLDAYGSDHDRWPKEDREQLEALLATSRHAQQLLKETAKLDSILDQFTVSDISQEVRKHVVDAIPFTKSGITERLLDWLFPEGPEFLWRPALAVTLPLLIGFILGLVALEPAEPLDNWEEDIYLVGVQAAGDTSL
ncbi:MAG: hypothetical protein QGD92_00720 [Gammaproteobacteria bacterium]|nr:hypothetical protein [Gammaproteobacteria bacterium]